MRQDVEENGEVVGGGREDGIKREATAVTTTTYLSIDRLPY